MKYIKVITEVRKENFEKELANYMSQGFDIKFSNIALSEKYIATHDQNLEQSITNSLSIKNNTIYNSIVYYALLIKETPE